MLLQMHFSKWSKVYLFLRKDLLGGIPFKKSTVDMCFNLCKFKILVQLIFFSNKKSIIKRNQCFSGIQDRLVFKNAIALKAYDQ